MDLMAHFTKEFHDYMKHISGSYSIDPYDTGGFGRYEFYMFSTGVGIGIAALGLICAFSGLMEKKYGALSVSLVALLGKLSQISFAS